MTRSFLGAVLLLGLASPVAAEVTDKSPGGFTSRTVRSFTVPSDVLYRAIVNAVGDWWDKEHTYSGDSKNLSIVAEPGGCFCEKWDGGAVRHAEVINVAEGTLLRMNGALGPLQESGVTGALTFQIEREGNGSKLTVIYGVGGYFPLGLDRAAPIVDGVIAQQVERLKKFVEAR